MGTFWKIFIAVIVTAGIVGGGGYYYMSKKAASDKSKLEAEIAGLEKTLADLKSAGSSLTSSTATDETAGWKIYTHSLKAFNVSFKYPDDWIVDGYHLSYLDSFFKIYKTASDKDDAFISIDFAGGPGDISYMGDEISTSTTTINGINLDILEYSKCKSTSHPGYPETDFFNLEAYYYNANKKSELLSIYDKIFSTLQITK